MRPVLNDNHNKRIVQSIERLLTTVILSVSIFFSFLLINSVILTFLHQFKAHLIYLLFIPSFVLTLFFFFRVRRDINLLPKLTLPVVFIIFFVSTILFLFPHDIFGGADEAMYVNYAVHLSQSASLEFPSNLSNLPEKLIEAVKPTPPGYVVFLALQNVFFGTQGLLHANVILIILGLSSFFLVSSIITGRVGGVVSILLYSSSMPFLWFSRETMSENLSFFLLWTLILFLFLSLKTKRLLYIGGVMLCSWLFGITRIEGFLLQYILLLVIPGSLFFRHVTQAKKIILVVIFFLFVTLSNLSIVHFTFGSYINEAITSVVYQIKRSVASTFTQKPVINDAITDTVMNMKKETTLYDRIYVFFAQMLIKYNFFLAIYCIFVIAAWLTIRIKRPYPFRAYFMIILLIIIPEYYKLVSPGIAIFEPWLYRRYVYALLPFGYLSLFLLINQHRNKKIFTLILSCLLIINIMLSGQILFLKNNWLLVDKMEEITKEVSKNDFVMIQSWDIGDYHPGSFLVVNKGIRSSFTNQIRPSQLLPDEKTFNGVSYNKIYLLSTNEKDTYSSFVVTSRKSVDIEFDKLVPACQLKLLGKEMGLTNPYNIGILPLGSVIKYCSKPGNNIMHYKGKFYLYELVYDKARESL